MAATAILADVDTGTLARSLAIAVLLVLPYGAVKYRQVRRQRLVTAAATAPAGAPPGGPTLEAVVEAISGLDPAVGGTVELPDGCTVDGQPVDDQVVELLLADALSRSGLRVGSRSPGTAGRRLHCVPVVGGDGGPDDRGADDGDAVRP